MKRILISAVAAGALLGQLNAVEIIKDGDKKLEVFGVANAVIGYGANHGASNSTVSNSGDKHAFIYGIQGNSRIGLKFEVGNIFGAALIGATEQYGISGVDVKDGNKSLDAKLKNIPGFRQLYAGYNFGDAGKLLAGRNELITSMGFSSSIFDAESGLNGFGGVSTSTRRFQIAYSIAGLTVSLSENESSYGKASIPRISLGYETKSNALDAKVAASYAHLGNSSKHMAYIVAGVKPKFGTSYVSAMAAYGLNSNVVGEQAISTAELSQGYANWGVSADAGDKNKSGFKTLGATGSLNTNIVSLMLEYGIDFSEDLGFKLGAGYQIAKVAHKDSSDLHAYSAFVQLPYQAYKHSSGAAFKIIPQVGYIGTTLQTNGTAKTKTKTGDFLAEVLFKLSF